jgi:hypothetical protein
MKIVAQARFYPFPLSGGRSGAGLLGGGIAFFLQWGGYNLISARVMTTIGENCFRSSRS